MLVDFCLPIKNEAKILNENAWRLHEYLKAQNLFYNWRIVVIVNGTSDNSWIIAQELCRNSAYFKTEQVSSPGKSNALKYYFSKSEADILAFMDIDLSVSLLNIKSLIDPILENKADLVIGSRLLLKSSVARRAPRSLGTRIYNKVANLLLNGKTTDLQCGFKAFKHSLFNELNLFFKDKYWFFDTELVTLSNLFGYRVVEIPVDWRENRFESHPSQVRLFKDGLIFLKNLLFFRQRLKEIKKYRDNA